MTRFNRMQVVALFSFLSATSVVAQDSSKPKFKADVPASIQTPDTVETRIGTLKFADGLPDQATVQKVYDNIDFSRGVEAFLSGMPAASVYAMCKGLADVGAAKNKGIGITENLMDARSLFLTANTTTVYVFFCVDLSNGPVVAQVPPGVLGPVDDAYFRYVTDVGIIGPDKGKGGKYLFVPPGYSEKLPSDGYFVTKSPTNTNFVLYRAFVKDGDIAAAVKSVKEHARVYPLSAAEAVPETAFVNLSGAQINTIHANDFHFYEELNDVIQSEPGDAFDPELVGLFASIGIKKGEPFAPDARMKAILTDAVAVGNATARSMVFDPREARAKFYPDRQWNNGFIGNSYQFLNDGERMLDPRTMFHYAATGITPAMADAKPGTGSAYAFAVRDATGAYLDGSKTYKITLPSPIPAGQFWSFTVYDNQTRSMLETDQKLAGIDSNQPSIKKNQDGSVTIWFSPTVPAGHETNWVQTMPGKGWNTILRLYAPLEPWFDKSWKPGDFEKVQ
ncbi:DUF1254 domain-containing protein [Rhizobium nepotum]|uniref:Signal peptide protein n=1 Tax=Rhizobium nepotum 39/7 TaxID=1368418 RepID=A0ABR5CNV6_9HYPH|nr:DUF1254 domain-containing protein [Rhizobium nepotum]KJF66366.1 signal peptide protein [Rhizobium nepotum 39/7]